MPKLTKTIVDNIVAPDSGDSWTWDTELEGFGVRTQASGRKTFVVRYRVKNPKRTQRKLTICPCSHMPPDKAREKARKIFSQVADGRDPAAERKPEAKNEKTVARMFEGYVAYMRARKCASAGEVERALLKAKDNAADALGRNKPAADVTPADIVNYVSRFFHRGHRGAANKHRGYIFSAYAFAIKSANDYTVPVAQRVDYGVTINPVAAVAKDLGANNTRERNLSADEIRQLWLATENDQAGFWMETAACIRLLICCGQRVQETLRIAGADIDLDAALWRMPAEKTKGKKRDHNIPLPSQAVETLRPLIEKHGDGPLFPARGGVKGELMDHQSIMQAIDRWLAREGVEMERFQTRDLRRTWKSRSHDAGIDRFTRDLVQQHSQGDTGSKHYDRAVYLPQMRDAMKKWSRWLSIVIGGGTPPAYGEPMIKVVSGGSSGTIVTSK